MRLGVGKASKFYLAFFPVLQCLLWLSAAATNAAERDPSMWARPLLSAGQHAILCWLWNASEMAAWKGNLIMDDSHADSQGLLCAGAA